MRFPARRCSAAAATARGNLLIALIAGNEAEQLRRALVAIRVSGAIRIPGFDPNWGVSSISGAAVDYRTAHREAAVALLAATKFGAKSIAISEELGVLGLLLSIRSDVDVTGVVGAILGEVVEHDLKHNRVLARTLRAYFNLDCSLQATALRLHVHQKTVRYRLTQFEQLSGMDLRRHEHRVTVDLTLRM
ncbi:PucR family transcriptional regulator [Paraburkholderia sp. 35.1]|uniref:PucR family transcriptional regulator n=1 Tax=unclassified Paraburkholderia TaxID=2615204 RepID=UPI003D23455B